MAVLADGSVVEAGPVRRLFDNPSLLARAGLALPPLAEVSARLDRSGRYRHLLTIEDYLAAIGPVVAAGPAPADRGLCR